MRRVFLRPTVNCRLAHVPTRDRALLVLGWGPVNRRGYVSTVTEGRRLQLLRAEANVGLLYLKFLCLVAGEGT